MKNFKMSEHTKSRLMKSRQAASYLAISERTLWNLQKDGKIKSVRMGRLIRFDPADLDDFIEQAKTAG